MSALGPYVWNIDNVGTRFFRCQMSLSEPFQDPARVRFEPLYWIYVRRESLDRFTGGGRTAKAAANHLERGQAKPKSRSGFYAVKDRPLVEEMRRLMSDGIVRSVHHAAGQLADRATGDGTVESKQTRLAKAYRRTYPDGTK